jgi:hypothetical protein
VGVGNKVAEVSLGRERIRSRDVLDSLAFVGDRSWGPLGDMALVSGRQMDVGMIEVWKNGEKRNSWGDGTFAERSYKGADNMFAEGCC